MVSNNIKDCRSSSSSTGISIPERLRKYTNLRYILLEKKDKKPKESKWGSKKNYPCDSPRLQEYISRGGNYGLACGFSDLAVFDSDQDERLNDLGILSTLGRTFTVRTGGGGTHMYYFCPDLGKKIILYDPVLLDDKGNPLHLGEIQWKGQQVVGPGSIHPNGKRYEVIDDTEIATITRDQLVEAISTLKTSKKRDNGNKNTARKGGQIYGEQIHIKEVAWPTGNVQKRDGKNGTEYFGSHPKHGSASGENFHINVDKNTWYCHRCQSGGGPLEWIAVEAGLISCSDAGSGCLRGEKFRQVLEIAYKRGYKMPDLRRLNNQDRIIENRIVLEELPEDLPSEPIVVIEGPPRIGKTRCADRQLIKAGSGNYISHRHSIVLHAIDTFRKEGGRNAVLLEGKHRPGMCRNDSRNCADCEYKMDRHNYLELKDVATALLKEHKILTKKEVPADLCPYIILKLAEEIADYCFTVAHFINDIQDRSLTVLDEDPTLAHFYPSSVELLKIKSERNEYKFDNTLGMVWGSIEEIKDRIMKKSRLREEDRLILSATSKLEAIKGIIDNTRDGRIDIEQCCQKVSEQIEPKTKVDPITANKALSKLGDDYRIDCTSDVDFKNYFTALLFPYEKRPVHMLSSSGSGYSSMYLIGDASSPTVNMSWTSTDNRGSEHKVLIIGNTLAELFAKSLGNAVVIEIRKFKYARNFVVVPVDCGNEDTYRGKDKNQRLKVRKLIKAVAGGPDSKSRHPNLALVGSKDHQDWLMRSLGGIAHASQDEGEIGQQWNYRGGYVNIFYQNSAMSRGLDVDEYNVIFVHDVDFAQPFWSAAIAAGDEGAEDLLNSIIMDETTNSVLRISPVVGRGEFNPKIVVIPRADLWKVRYLDDQVLGGSQGGRTKDIDYVARLILEENLTGTVQLDGKGSDKCKAEWEEAVKNNKVVGLFRVKLDRVKDKDNFTEEEILNAMNKICQVLNAGKGKWLSIIGMKELGLKCKNALIRPALGRLYYDGIIEMKTANKKNYWKIVSQNVDRFDVLPATDSRFFDANA